MSESRAATETELQELHRLVASALLTQLHAAPCEACGRCSVEPAMLKCAIAFLRDNSIAIDPHELADMQRSLRQLVGISLPFKPKE